MGVRIATQHQRLELAAAMDFLVAHEPQVHYAQTRPIPRIPSLTALEAIVVEHGLTTDCSGSVTILAQVVGLHDPNGNGYNGAGNTQVMYDHLPHFTKPQASAVGGLWWVGIPGRLETQHICMNRHPGPDPVLFSHGQERGPLYVPLSVELAYHQKAHPGSVGVFLSIAHL